MDDVLVDGATIGHTDDTNLITLSNGTMTVDGTVAATTLTGDGSGITGVSASSIKSDDITAGDAAVTIKHFYRCDQSYSCTMVLSIVIRWCGECRCWGSDWCYSSNCFWSGYWWKYH